jgi:hypothetical protein
MLTRLKTSGVVNVREALHCKKYALSANHPREQTMATMTPSLSNPALRSFMHRIRAPGFICVPAASMFPVFTGSYQLPGRVIRLNVTNFALSCSLLRTACDEVRQLGPSGSFLPYCESHGKFLKSLEILNHD